MLQHFSTRVLPAGLEFLAELSFDLRWTYNHRADELFKALDPYLWELTHNPYLIIETVSLDHCNNLAKDETFTIILTILKRSGENLIPPPPGLQKIIRTQKLKILLISVWNLA
ncbi:MAG: DUF3417 domain-containing protein [Deltaproteobacteria bacterium]|nr:DUF3417 domain-containing protein [Deltaproteobacteria bacterium]